jgi:molybdopterin/thiamine biosynthesis adenylyltransferase
MGYRLADRVQLVELDDRRVFLVDDEIMELEGCSAAVIEALKRLKSGCESESLDELLTPEERQQLLELLEEHELLRENSRNEYQGQMVEKQIYYFDDFGPNPNSLQCKLEKVRVAILGVGGVGAVVIQHLVGAGLRHFVLIDGDIVQQDNLNRQFLYRRDQIGMPKVEAAAAYIRSIDPNIEVATHRLMVDAPECLQVLDAYELDLFINAADQPKDLDLWLNRYCTERCLPWIGAAVGRHKGTWGPLVVPGQTMCMDCFCRSEDEQMDEVERAIRERMNPLIRASFGPTNTVISTLLAKDVILYLATGASVPSLNARCSFDFENLAVERYEPREALPCTCWKGES